MLASSRHTWSEYLAQTGRGALDLLMSGRCEACRSELNVDADCYLALCRACQKQCVRSVVPSCSRCAARLPSRLAKADSCGQCCTIKPRFDRTLAWGDYQGLLRQLVLKMKQERSPRLAHLFARLLIRDFDEQLDPRRFNALVAVPRHFGRRLDQRINPPEEIACFLGRVLQIPVLYRCLMRRNSFVQKRLSRESRFRHMHGQMRLRTGYPLEAYRLLLIDDILTTGATCSEAARVLKQAGAAEVTALVVARTQQVG